MDYSTYKTRVAKELNRDDLDTIANPWIREWINEARKQLVDGTLPIAVFEAMGWYRFSWCYTTDAQTLAASTREYDFPVGTIDEISLFYPTTEKPLVKIDDPAYFDALFMNGHGLTDTGPPKNYLLRGTQYEIFPLPDAAYELYFRRYAYQTDLVADDSEYTIDTKHPNLVIYAATLLGAIYLHDAELIALYDGKASQVYRNAVLMDKRKKFANVNLRMKNYHDYNLDHYRGMRQM